jgi:hypothetical protein
MQSPRVSDSLSFLGANGSVLDPPCQAQGRHAVARRPRDLAVMEPYLNAANVGILPDARASVGSAPPHPEIVDLVETTNEMEDERDGEAAWNYGVHYPFLRLALHHSTWREELRCHNV